MWYSVQTLLQLHILLSAAPALVGWTLSMHPAPVVQVTHAAYQRALHPQPSQRNQRPVSTRNRIANLSAAGQAVSGTGGTARTTRRVTLLMPALPQGILLPHAPRAP